MKKGTFQPYAFTTCDSTIGEIAPPMLPHIFMSDETEPARSPAISSGMAHDTPTVNSMPKKARQVKSTHKPGLAVRVAGMIKTAPARNPTIATGRREFRLPL